MPFGGRKLEWKLGESGSEEIIDKNVRLIDMVFGRLSKRCGNPFCKWPISSLRTDNLEIPEYGEVCSLCFGLYSTLTYGGNPQLKGHTFRNAHNEWKAENNPDEIKRKRRRLGLDGEGNGFT
jgi:hypothetical protein